MEIYNYQIIEKILKIEKNNYLQLHPTPELLNHYPIKEQSSHHCFIHKIENILNY